MKPLDLDKPSENLDYKLINKFHNVNLYANITGTHTFTLNETIKDVKSIKLNWLWLVACHYFDNVSRLDDRYWLNAFPILNLKTYLSD